VDLSILVISCDKYRDVWDLFFVLFWQHWPDCPYPVFLGANRLTYHDRRVTTLLSGEDRSWGESVRRMVEQVESPYILLFLDDYFLLRPVATADVASCLEALRKLRGGYLRLDPAPPPDRQVPGFSGLGEIEPGSPYRCSLRVAIWRKDVLLSLLRNGETAWDMELKGSRRSDELAVGFYATWKPVVRHDMEGVVRGKWTRAALRLAKRQGVTVDTVKRQALTRGETVIRRIRMMKARLLTLVPWSVRKRILNKRLCRIQL
jgi:hypothetical protein